ncbi:RtcB family protein [Patescibacteria group bacterium]|nr:RtcB family protein [Patescibacteria group bacterium]
MQISDFKKINDWLWEIPIRRLADGIDMKVPARIYASEVMLKDILQDRSIEQIINVATMPGIYKYALAMPDIHEGYGFPIGGVAAMDVEKGLISPGGIGYDINCGVRLLRSRLEFKDVKSHLESLGRAIFKEVPSGVGRGGWLKLKDSELDEVLKNGVSEMQKRGYTRPEDIGHTESNGTLPEADPSCVSSHAKNRGRDQLGTLGAGNHFVEIGIVERIFDDVSAKTLGLFENQVTVLIHTGSRGLGHQIATDYIRIMMKAMPKYGINLPDRELAAVPFQSEEGQNYFRAMQAGANFAWSNRQLITWEVRNAWQGVLGDSGGSLELIYDVSHNLAKLEEYDGKKFVIHRKGATRAFGKGHPELTEDYRNIGQPVLIPGSMGTGSYVLVGLGQAMKESFGSSCHGAGRRMSRTQARREIKGDVLEKELMSKGIIVNAGSRRRLTEEAPGAYKDIDKVVDIVHNAGIAKKVVRLKPIVVIKG